MKNIYFAFCLALVSLVLSFVFACVGHGFLRCHFLPFGFAFYCHFGLGNARDMRICLKNA